MNDQRFRLVPKLLETPKHGAPVEFDVMNEAWGPIEFDVMNLEFLRALRR